jgi:hypothetical protein
MASDLTIPVEPHQPIDSAASVRFSEMDLCGARTLIRSISDQNIGAAESRIGSILGHALALRICCEKLRRDHPRSHLSDSAALKLAFAAHKVVTTMMVGTENDKHIAQTLVRAIGTLIDPKNPSAANMQSFQISQPYGLIL